MVCTSALLYRRFNTQPPEGGCAISAAICSYSWPFQHTATRRWLLHAGPKVRVGDVVSTHSHPKVAAPIRASAHLLHLRFQHTATRRWLLEDFLFNKQKNRVSTHSHPKVAAGGVHPACAGFRCFNTQPPEGGCSLSQKPCSIRSRSPDFAKLPRKVQTRV